MATPNRLANRYLEALGEDAIATPKRSPLQPFRTNHRSPTKLTKSDISNHEDLEILARQLEISTPKQGNSLLRNKFETSSATISSFKSPSNKSSTNSANSPIRGNNLLNNKPSLVQKEQEQPDWAKKDYREILNKSPTRRTPIRPKSNLHNDTKLTPLKFDSPKNSSPTPKSSPFLSSPGNSCAIDSPGYEYLCRIQAIKNWLEKVLQEEIVQSPQQLIDYIRNGIHLAKLSNVILPYTRNVFLNDSKLQFRHTENINRFFQLLDYMNVPDLFRFELTDLYDAKNVPKVWFCLHALSYMLNKVDSRFPKIENLVDYLDFSEDDIRKANRALVGTGLPNFASADNGEPIPQPVERKQYSPIKFNQDIMEDLHMKQNSIVESNAQTCGNDSNSDEINTQNPFYISTNTLGTRLFQNQEESIEVVDNNKEDIISLDLKYELYNADLKSFQSQIIKLQSLCRGANFRYRMFVDRIILKSYSEEITEFISVCRGNMTRLRTIHKHRDEISPYKGEIIDFQSISRTFLLKNRLKMTVHDSSAVISQLQSIIRGCLTRSKVKSYKFHLYTNMENLVQFQSVIRRNKVFNTSNIVLNNISWLEPQTIMFQSICRSYLYKLLMGKLQLQEMEDSIIPLQTLIRGNISRNRVRVYLARLRKCKLQIQELQSIARGGISRTMMCNDLLVNLLVEDETLNEFFALVRGKFLRRRIANTKYALKQHERSSIIPIQTMFRGIFARFKKEILVEDLYENVNDVIKLQAVSRGFSIRNKIIEMNDYYKKNEKSVIIVQSCIRASMLQSSYNSLISLKNPPLSVIRKFAYLLTDNDVDYQEIMELSDLKDKIIDISKHNEVLESHIENLDIKLSLLDKNKITVEEFLKNKKIQKPFKPSSSISINNFGKLNKSSKEKIEFFESIFYLLQTKPIYFIRLLRTMDISTKTSKFYRELQIYILLLYPIKTTTIDNHEREEYFFVKLIFNLMELDVQQNCSKFSDLTKTQTCFWIEFLLHLNNHTYQRQHLKSMIGKFVQLVVESEALDFELDPVLIYHIIRDREVKIHGFSDKVEDISAQSAIKESDVSGKFVENLMGLRESATELLKILDSIIDKVPVHVRLVCKHAYHLSQLQFPDKSHKQHLAVAGVIFIKHYVAAILQFPENFGYLSKDSYHPSLFYAKSKDNLKHLSRVMLQLFSMKQFSDNFLKPLNDFVILSMEVTANIVVKLINVKSIEIEMKMSDYDDIVTHDRPKLSINVNKLISLEKIVTQNIDIMAPSADDQLYSLVINANNIVNSARDLISLTEMGMITLSLNPSTKEDSIADSKATTLFTQVKRCLLYIIRIQEGECLLDLLVSGIKPHDEAKFRRIVEQEKEESFKSQDSMKRKPYYKTSLGNLSSISYHELKKMALTKLLELESMNLISRKDSFQTILNEIAIDIKTKDSQRKSRKIEIEITAKTVEKLREKEIVLEKQLADYNKHVESLLYQIQLKPKERKIFNIIPVFSKQYFYHRELRKQNRLPKFGSYRYSAKKLIEQKVLLDCSGLVNESHVSSSKLDFMFSCHEVGKFTLEAANGSVAITGALCILTLDDLLNLQYEDQPKLNLFHGMAVFSSENFTELIFRKFYEIKKDKF